jgi:23S rRNA (guanosine2251-2'-O)-methyltransferase
MSEKRQPPPPKRAERAKNKFSGNHQRSWLWGHYAVLETLATGVWPVYEIVSNANAFKQSCEVLAAKHAAGIPLEIVDNDRLQQLTGSSEHQGLAVRLGPFPYQSLDSLSTRLQLSPPSDNVPLVVICDRLQDAFNFGAILRCCDGVNVMAVIIGDYAQADVTPHVVRSSSGAVNHLSIVKVSSLIETVQRLKQLGFQIVAADANTDTGLWSAKLTQPTALIIGSEATGVQSELLAACDQRLWIPMQGRVRSLNAAVAAGILLYEIRRQQHTPCET